MIEQRTLPKLCVLGSINFDSTFRVPHIPNAGETILATASSSSLGGKGANQAVAAAFFGADVTLLGCVGDGNLGLDALRLLSSRGIDTSKLEISKSSTTGIATVLVADDGENVIVVDPGANQFLSTRNIELYFNSDSPTVVLAQLEINLEVVLAASLKTAGVFILNPAPMTSDTKQLEEILRRTDVLVPNRTELGRLVKRSTPLTLDEVDSCIAELNFEGDVIVTLGKDGVAIYEQASPDLRILIEPLLVNSIDSSGAGDAFCGVLASEISAGRSLHEAAFVANQVAALSTTTQGAQLSPELQPLIDSIKNQSEERRLKN